MSKTFKPAGYNSASPYFIINGAQKLIDLLVQLFDAKLLRRYEMPDGSIMHAEVMLDDSVIMMGDASERFPANKLVMHVYVADVDTIYKKALSLGCTEVEPPKQREGDPDRRATFEDFAGNMWSVGTQL
jgi:PhnB protein